MEISNNLFSQTIYKSKVMANPKVDDADLDAQQPVTSETQSVNSQSAVATTSPANTIADIKNAIFNYSHPTVNSITSSYGGDFDSICATMGISPTKKITKADLTKLTRNDALEDSNQDFIGALNRAFSYLEPNDTISYNDVMLFFMRGVSTINRSDNVLSFSEYQTVVQRYSNIVQRQYEACSTEQEKLEFIIDKTKDYLIESRMDMQLAALERLTVTTASDNVPNPSSSVYLDVVPQVANVGQVAFANLGGWGDGYITGGAYGSWSEDAGTRYNNSEVSRWWGDEDAYYDDIDGKHWVDNGITLNTELYFKANPYNGEIPKWYEVVGVLVHELTHATAYFYYNVDAAGNITYTQQGLNFMASKGVISAGQYSTTDTSAQLKYLVATMYDEWAAYSTSCNYWDSIGGDVFDYDNLAVNGTSEESAIRSHLRSTGYDYTGDDGLWHERPIPNISYENLSKMFYFA